MSMCRQKRPGCRWLIPVEVATTGSMGRGGTSWLVQSSRNSLYSNFMPNLNDILILDGEFTHCSDPLLDKY